MRIALITGLLLVLGACDSSEPSPDARRDPTNIIDAGQPDAGTSPDAGTPDAGTSPDAGSPDAGTPPDGGTSDGGTQTGSRPSPSNPRWPALQTSISTYELTLSQDDYNALWAHIPDPPSRKFQVEGRFTHEGRSYPAVLSFRGRSTKTDPRVVKKSWDVRFENKEERFEGKKNIELLATWKDGGYLTEKLWYDLAASVGLRVPRARYVHVKLHLVQDDGRVITKYEGVFTELESLNKDFLEAHGFDEDGDLYRCGMHDCELRQPPQEQYQERWDKKTNEKQPWDGLWSFLEGVNRTPPHRFPAFLQEKLELEDYLTWLALETFIDNDLQGDSRSYLIYDGQLGKWTYVPWDLNNAVSLYNRTNHENQGVKEDHPLLSFTAYDPGVYELADFRRTFPDMQDMKPAWSTLSTRLYDDPGLRARYVARLRKLLDTWFTEENIGPRVDAMHRLLAPFIVPGRDGRTVDPYVSPKHVVRSPGYLHDFVRERRKWLLEHIQDVEALGSGALVIDRVGRDASGTFWVQLYNRGSVPVPVGGLYLSGFTRVPGQWKLPALTVEPGQVVTFRQGAPGTAHLGATLDPERPEVSLYAADGKSAMDLLWLAPLKPGEAYGRQPRGAESFGSQPGP